MAQDGLSQWIRGLDKLKSSEIPKATSAAINKVGKRVQTESVRSVAKQSKVPAKHVRRKFFLRRSKPGTQKAVITGYTRPISVHSLKHRVLKRGGISAAGRKYPHAFKTTVRKSGKEQIFQRTTADRYPLEVVTIDVSDLMTTALRRFGPRIVREELPKLLEHEFQFRLERLTR